jgi:shikimate dehydrogenase
MFKVLFLGSHLGHSLLPLVYKLISKEIKLEIQIIEHQIMPHEVKSIITDAVLSKFLFCCITFPYKMMVSSLVDTKTERAQASQSVNIAYWDNERGIVGDNTDGKGFSNDLKNRLKVLIANEKVLVLGNGGVSNGIIPELLCANPQKITICKRAVSNTATQKHENLSVCSYEDLPMDNYKLVVNATSASIYNQVPPLTLHEELKNAFFYECAYSKNDKTSFEKFLFENQIFNYSSGLGMLIEQAAVAIENILTLQVDTSKILEKLSNEISLPAVH